MQRLILHLPKKHPDNPQDFWEFCSQPENPEEMCPAISSSPIAQEHLDYAARF